MGWLDRLTEEIGSKIAEQAPAQEPMPAPVMHEVTITVRNSNGNDPGEIASGYYTVTNGVLQMVSVDGAKLGEPIALGPADARAVAASQFRQRLNGDSGFSRRLEYPPLPIV